MVSSTETSPYYHHPVSSSPSATTAFKPNHSNMMMTGHLHHYSHAHDDDFSASTTMFPTTSPSTQCQRLLCSSSTSESSSKSSAEVLSQQQQQQKQQQKQQKQQKQYYYNNYNEFSIQFSALSYINATNHYKLMGGYTKSKRSCSLMASCKNIFDHDGMNLKINMPNMQNKKRKYDTKVMMKNGILPVPFNKFINDEYINNYHEEVMNVWKANKQKMITNETSDTFKHTAGKQTVDNNDINRNTIVTPPQQQQQHIVPKRQHNCQIYENVNEEEVEDDFERVLRTMTDIFSTTSNENEENEEQEHIMLLPTCESNIDLFHLNDNDVIL